MFIFFEHVSSQTINTAHFKFKRYSIDEGLTVGQVNGVARDENGLEYITTEDGLFVFNGMELERLFHNLKSTRLRQICYIPKLGIVFKDDFNNIYKLIDKKIELLYHAKDVRRPFLFATGFYGLSAAQIKKFPNLPLYEILEELKSYEKINETTLFRWKNDSLILIKDLVNKLLLRDRLLYLIHIKDRLYLVHQNHLIVVNKGQYKITNDTLPNSLRKIGIEMGLHMGDYIDEVNQSK
ncbi:MAG: hypothetical protein HYZ42_10700, partial [Bacteroidetes bacterium]|nr:hypothetical protein [Bacteroidota bacterium]